MKHISIHLGLAALLSLHLGAWAASTTYTLDADFDQGSLDGVNHDAPNNDQLQLSTVGTTFPVMWIANAGEDTLSKIDTNLNEEVARYRTWFGPSGQPGYINHINNAYSGAAPSRTAVDIDGNAYVANRWFANVPPVVLKILAEGGIDRNGNGVIDTSTDLNNDGIISGAEILPMADSNGNGIIDCPQSPPYTGCEIQDERIAWAARVGPNNGLGRSMCIGTDGNLWVGMYNARQYYKVSSADGGTLGGPYSTGSNTPYGCLVDGNGILWGASLSNNLFKLDTNNPASTSIFFHSGSDYGIALGNGKVYQANYSGLTYTVFDPATNTFSDPSAINFTAYGIAVDGNGDIIAGNVGSGGFTKFAPNGSVICTGIAQPGTGEVRGVAVDANNDVWLIHRTSANISKHSGTNCAAIGVYPVGNQPYTYSDAAGFAARNITNPTGTWTVINDGGAAGTQWGTVSWNSLVPQDTSVSVEVRVADTMGGLPLQSYQPVGNGIAFSATGRYIQVRTRLSSTSADNSPILYDLTVSSVAQAKCDVDQDGDIDKLDTNAILRARGQTALPGDPRDADGDGLITVRDGKLCIQQCTRPSCAIQ